MSDSTTSRSVRSFGIDLGAKRSHVCVMRDGKIESEFVVNSTPASFSEAFVDFEDGGRVLMEVCGSSPWASKILEEMGFEVAVCQATILKETVAPKRKNDRDDARALAKLCDGYRGLLRPVRHRSEELETLMRQIRLRRMHVELRTAAVNGLRGSCRSSGVQLKSCSPETLPKHAREMLTAKRTKELELLIETIEYLSKTISKLDEVLDEIAAKYPETKLLQQVSGVGPVTSLTFIATVQNPSRFPHTRTVGNYIGLTPKQYQSGDRDPQLRISKSGDSYLRSLLVQCAQHILSHESADSDLRRFGLKLAEQGGARGRKRAIVAMARKLAVLLLSLWKSGEQYDPLRNTKHREQQVTPAIA